MRGCEFELQQLARRLTPGRLVLVVDAATDQAAFQAAYGPGLGEVRRVEVGHVWQADRASLALLEAAG